MRKSIPAILICMIVVFGIALGENAPTAEEIKKAGELLDTAEWYLENKDYANAQKYILQALDTTHHNAQIQERAKPLWEKARQGAAEAANQQAENARVATIQEAEKKKQEELKKRNVQLDEAELLLKRGKDDEAAKIAIAVLSETTDESQVTRAKSILEQTQPGPYSLLRTSWQRFFVILGWAMDLLLVIVALIIIYYLLLIPIRKIRTIWKRYDKRQSFDLVRDRKKKLKSEYHLFWEAVKYVWETRKDRPKWLVNAISDTSNLGVAEAVTDQLSRWSEQRVPVSAGLLRLETLQVPTVPQLELPRVDVDLAPALEAINLTVGAVSLSSVAKALTPIRNWLNAKRLWIKGSVAVVDSQVIVSLTRRNADDKTNTVTASTDKTKSKDAAEAASYKMYYLIATKGALVSNAESSNKLREGLKLLGQYISGQGTQEAAEQRIQQLRAAYEAFRNVRNEDPSLNEAYLYEGIALDLLENHDEALRRFQYLTQSTNIKQTLKDKASYNEAVSLFRKYRPDDLKKAIEILGRLIELPGDWETNLDYLAKSPFKALAFAAKANAVAHKPIFWQQLTFGDFVNDEDKVRGRKQEKQAEVNGWVEEVEKITGHLKDVLKKAQPDNEVWDDFTRQQLDWAIENAFGNIHLNYAKSFLAMPNLEQNDVKSYNEHLQKAYTAFQDCEMILPPGVETLTNLGTVLIDLQRYDEARAYLRRANELNPNYEYAYYRMAQSWDQKGRVDEVVKILRSFARDRTPRISGFDKLYQKYAVELARYGAEPEKKADEQAKQKPDEKPGGAK